ncbi:hypothetical protein [Paenibacillus sp. KN14-4R]|uniref:hypothetical protein n=1 Tax=Paenibacillus sp. KN14-4R TaxID=3445773 RepID=UPI003F9FBFC0
MSLLIFIGIACPVILLFRCFQSYQAKKEVGDILLKGYRKGVYDVIISFLNFVTFFTIFEYGWQYSFMLFLLITAALEYISRAYLGESGLKINGKFIEKDQILRYRVVEGSLNEVEFIIAGKDDVRVTFTKKTYSGGLETVLHQFLYN